MADHDLLNTDPPAEQNDAPSKESTEQSAVSSTYVENAAKDGEPIEIGEIRHDNSPAEGAKNETAEDFPEAIFGAGPSRQTDNEQTPDAPAQANYNVLQSDKTKSFGGVAASFFHWLGNKFKAIPPFEDFFDMVLSGLGLQRKPASMLKRANSLALKGRLSEAIKWYRELLALKPLSVAAYDGLGRAYFRMGLTEEADREFYHSRFSGTHLTQP